MVGGALVIGAALDGGVVVAESAAADVAEVTVEVVGAGAAALSVDADEVSAVATVDAGAALGGGALGADAAAAELIVGTVEVSLAGVAAEAVDADSAFCAVAREVALVTCRRLGADAVFAELALVAVAVVGAAGVNAGAVFASLAFFAVAIDGAVTGDDLAQSVDAGFAVGAVGGVFACADRRLADAVVADVGSGAVAIRGALGFGRVFATPALADLPGVAIGVAVALIDGHGAVAGAVGGHALRRVTGAEALEAGGAVAVLVAGASAVAARGVFIECDAERAWFGAVRMSAALVTEPGVGLVGGHAVALRVAGITVGAVGGRATLGVVDDHDGRRVGVDDAGVVTLGEALVPAPPGVAIGVADVVAGGDHLVAVVVVKEAARAEEGRAERGGSEQSERRGAHDVILIGTDGSTRG